MIINLYVMTFTSLLIDITLMIYHHKSSLSILLKFHFFYFLRCIRFETPAVL